MSRIHDLGEKKKLHLSKPYVTGEQLCSDLKKKMRSCMSYMLLNLRISRATCPTKVSRKILLQGFMTPNLVILVV